MTNCHSRIADSWSVVDLKAGVIWKKKDKITEQLPHRIYSRNNPLLVLPVSSYNLATTKEYQTHI